MASRPTENSDRMLCTDKLVLSCRDSSDDNCFETTSTAKSLPLVGNSALAVQNSKQFVGSISDLCIHEDEMMVSYDVASLFATVPRDLGYICSAQMSFR